MTLCEGKLDNIHISALASAVSQEVADNYKYAEALGGKRGRRQIMLTGIEHRHVCAPGQAASDLAAVAAEAVLKKTGWSREEIKLLIFVTQTPDLVIPSTAMLIQKRLNIPNTCSCFDINLGCSGFTVGLQVIGSMLSVTGGKALLLVGDGRYLGKNPVITANRLLFGHGSSAAAIEIAPGWPMLFDQYTDGRRFEVIVRRHTGSTEMDGNAVLLFAMNEVSQAVREFRERHNLTEEDIDYYVYHQAQQMVLQSIADETHTPWEKFLNSYQEYGNTSSASIPISLCANLDKLQDKPVHNFLLHGFGIGLSWGSVYMPIETDAILPMIESNYVYPDKDLL